MSKPLPSDLDLVIARKRIDHEGKVFEPGHMMTLAEWREALGISWGVFWNETAENALFSPTQEEREQYTATHPPKFVEPPEQKILRSTSMFDDLLHESGRFVEGEEEARAAILLIVGGGRLCANARPESTNLFVNAPSGTGKDYVVSATLSVLSADEDVIVKRKRISPTTLTYWHTRPDKNGRVWNWDGKGLYLEDVSSAVLNAEVFKVFSSSHGGKVTITKDQQATELQIHGKPCLIVTAAETECKHEQLRRFPIVQLTTTEEQTVAIKKRIAKEAAGSYSNAAPSEEIREAVQRMNRVCVTIPEQVCNGLVERLPNSLIMRTAFSRIFDYVKFSAALHQYQRKRSDNGFIIAEKQDYDIAARVVNATMQNSMMMPMTHQQMELLNLLRCIGEGGASFTALSEDKRNPYANRKGLLRGLNFLRQHKFARSETVFNIETRRENTTWKVVGECNANDGVMPSWDELISNTIDTTYTKDTKDTTDTNGVEVSSVSLVSKIFVPSKPEIHSEKPDVADTIKKHDPGQGVLLDVVRRLDGGDGAVYECVCAQCGEAAVKLAVERGDVFENKPGFLKVLE